MKLSLTVVGESIQEIEKAIEVFYNQVKNKQLESNCFTDLSSRQYKNFTSFDYSFTNGSDIFNNDVDEITVYPYE